MKTSLNWDGEAVIAVDQRALPGQYRLLRLASVDELISAIRSLAIRGAPAIGLAGALGVALSARLHAAAEDGLTEAVTADADRIARARPTAVNLEWGVRRALGRLDDGPEAVLAEALSMIEEDTATNRAAARRAADLVLSLTDRRPLRLLTHCNTGQLATAAGGTALGAILELAERGCVEEVLVDETRPLLQGSRLTAWELGEAAVPHRICVDSAAAAAMAQGMVDCVLVGADRITANGDVVNKIGTYGLAVAAAHHRIPFLVVAPESTWDRSLPEGSAILIEERDPTEVTHCAGTAVAPVGAGVYNPAFDCLLVAQRRVSPIRPSRDDSVRQLHRMLFQTHPSRGSFLVESHDGRDRSLPAQPAGACLGTYRPRLPPRRRQGRARHAQGGPRLARRPRRVFPNTVSGRRRSVSG
ncbi:S-methyl-5-thioribose-1-phosphate isomerase [Streptomyces sp. MUM 2J]|uniref:S-methyl-5-thioribose-1-phosphate isomerase n=1 Tax=Streptomyces sp. MUM 2J TaxID=2791987 RepID=UPI001F049DF9|nr:S-methyl-5-thioribose-1-phosphate isomerase [Streptomyces sp. MUM 2J]MCH0567428.1 S-methyl-5-thioribose-1-phosphate isomerase [Streptomyces sp. MUM 2J]